MGQGRKETFLIVSFYSFWYLNHANVLPNPEILLFKTYFERSELLTVKY